MNTWQKLGWGLGTLMLAERFWKEWMVRRFFERPLPVMTDAPHLVSILQPILSGDPTLAVTLEHNLRLKSAVEMEFIWLVDEADSEGQRICRELIARYPERPIQLVLLPPVPLEYNPKIFKLAEGRKVAQGDILCVLDDDTMLPDNTCESCLPFLDQPGVGLAFGLPYYVNFTNLWSSMAATYVDSNSLFTYIPYLAFTQPFTINGMFYMLRSQILDRMGGFEAIKQMLADDFAIAHLCRSHGYALAQAPLLHGISTQVKDARHYFRLLHRWFIFPRESILRHVSWYDRVIVGIMAVLPALFPLFLFLSLLLRPSWRKLCYTLLYFGCNSAIIARLNAKYLKGALPARRSWLVPVIAVLAPVQILIALCSPQRVNWRGHIVQIERGGGFNYIRRRQ